MADVRAEELDIGESDDVVRVRQVVRDAAVELGFSIVDQTKVVTAASELARNTYIYGGGGHFRMELLNSGSRHGLRLTFEDDGPRIPDIEPALRDGDRPGNGVGRGTPAGQRVPHRIQPGQRNSDRRHPVALGVRCDALRALS